MSGKQKKEKQPGVVSVPRGRIAVQTFDVFPVEPVDGKAQEWMITQKIKGEDKEVKGISVGFSDKSTPEQQAFECAQLIFNIDDEALEDQDWRFVFDGIQYCPNSPDFLPDLETNVTNAGRTLMLSVKEKGYGQALTAGFSFVAVKYDMASGEGKIYRSADPTVTTRRPA